MYFLGILISNFKASSNNILGTRFDFRRFILGLIGARFSIILPGPPKSAGTI